MKHKLLLLFLLVSNFAFSQNALKEEYEKQIKSNSEKINKIEAELKKSNSSILELRKSIKTISNELEKNSGEINKTREEANENIRKSESATENKITKVDTEFSKKSLYITIGILATILISLLLYFLLFKRQNSDKSNLLEELSRTKSSIEDTLVKEFGKQTELLDGQLAVIGQNKQDSIIKNIEPDHSLALKVASEINLIERNVNLMDPKTKGIKQLNQSVAKLKDNLAANGYEMPVLLDMQFHQGMKVIVTSSIPDETLEKGYEKITKVLIPQVNYNDKMIQTAQIEVSVGY